MSADHDHDPIPDLRPEFRLPAFINVLGHEYGISVVEDPDVSLGRVSGAEHALGLTDLNRGYVRIRGGGEQGEDAARDTLLHETFHIVAYLAQVDIEEKDLARLSTVLLHTLRTNPELVAALISR